MGRTGFLLLILSGGLCLSACRSSTSAPAAEPAKNLFADESELKMSMMHVQSFGDDGLNWELTAPYGEVFTRKNLMRVKTLAVQMFDQGKKSTDITAKQGVMSTGPKSPERTHGELAAVSSVLEPGDMYLSGDVVMVSTDGSKLTTDWAHYIKKKELIVSTAPVRVDRQDSITTGIGMEASSDMTQIHIFNETLIIPSTEGQP